MVANTPAALVNPTRTTAYDAPSPAFDKPRTDVQPGMTDSPNDHRDQVTPPTPNTDQQKAQIQAEQTARDRGQTVAVTEPMPAAPTFVKDDKQPDKQLTKSAP